MANSQRIDFVLNAAPAASSDFYWPGGNGSLLVEGTIGGATVQLQLQSPNGSWLNVGAGVTAVGVTDFTVPDGRVRVTITGGTPSAMFIYAVSNPLA